MFSSIQLYSESSSKNNSRQSSWNYSSARLADINLVPYAQEIAGTSTNSTETITSNVDYAITTGAETSFNEKSNLGYLSCIREKLQLKVVSEDTIKIILGSWRDGTKSQYQSLARKWFEFCHQHQCDCVSPSLPLALQFLSDLFNAGLSYSSINTARSMLSSLLCLENNHISFGQIPIVKRFLKGVFELRPSFPKYTTTWSISTVFTFIRKSPLSKLTLKELSYRIAFLLALLSGQRCQTLSKLSIDNMLISEEKITFVILEKLKHTRINSHQKPIEFLSYPNDSNLCIVTHLNKYLDMTRGLRGDSSKQLLISFIKPHKPISCDTISHWVKNFMALAGIDISIYTSHSTRGTSASHLASKNVNIRDIMAATGWSTEETFQRFYHFEQPDDFNYGDSILRSADLN